MTDTPMVHLDKLVVRYGRLVALDGVSFDIEKGAVGLLGPNGAGKSTLLKALLGFVRPDKGEIAMFGRKMPAACLNARRYLGYMPEKESVSPQISAVSFLTYCGRLFGMNREDARERAHEVLNFVGMEDNRYRKMETYSTGMLQRVKFAQALIHDPHLLLLDEPTNGLDPEGRLEMLSLIRELAHKRNVTILLSSHLLPDVQYVCERVIVLHKGQVVRDGNLKELTAVREGLYEVRTRDRWSEYQMAMTDAGCTCRMLENGNLLVQKPASMQVRAFFEIAHAQQTHLRHLAPVRRSLEEAFMAALNGETDGDFPAFHETGGVEHADI